MLDTYEITFWRIGISDEPAKLEFQALDAQHAVDIVRNLFNNELVNILRVAKIITDWK